MASGYGKKPFGKKLKSIFAKAVGIGLIGGACATPVWYHYGTIEEKEVKVTRVDEKYLGWDDQNWSGIYGDYKITTTGGSYNNENTKWNFKSNADDIQDSMEQGNTYRIKSYGEEFPLFGLHKNILSVTPVSEDELKAEAAATAEAKKAQALAQQQQGSSVTPSTTPQTPTVVTVAQPVLSGRMATRDLDIPGYTVQISMPEEALGKVTVNTVTPTVQRTVTPTTPSP